MTETNQKIERNKLVSEYTQEELVVIHSSISKKMKHLYFFFENSHPNRDPDCDFLTWVITYKSEDGVLVKLTCEEEDVFDDYVSNVHEALIKMTPEYGKNQAEDLASLGFHCTREILNVEFHKHLYKEESV